MASFSSLYKIHSRHLSRITVVQYAGADALIPFFRLLRECGSQSYSTFYVPHEIRRSADIGAVRKTMAISFLLTLLLTLHPSYPHPSSHLRIHNACITCSNLTLSHTPSRMYIPSATHCSTTSPTSSTASHQPSAATLEAPQVFQGGQGFLPTRPSPVSP
jgi:hypothetical protein